MEMKFIYSDVEKKGIVEFFEMLKSDKCDVGFAQWGNHSAYSKGW